MAWDGDSPNRIRGRAWQRIRTAVLSREPLCRGCSVKGRVTVAVEVDHIMPLAKGGTNDHENLQPLCVECHEAKTAREAAEAQGRTHRPRVQIGLDGWPISE